VVRRPANEEAQRIREALQSGKTIQWCVDTYGWPRCSIRIFIDKTPGWLVDSDRDAVCMFDREVLDESDVGYISDPVGYIADPVERLAWMLANAPEYVTPTSRTHQMEAA
jgi:hypothetical protein